MPAGRLRPAHADDLDALLQLLHEPDVLRYLCDGVQLPRGTVAAMLDHSDELDPRGLGFWMIEDRARACAGMVGLQPMAADAAPELMGGVEVIIAVASAHWGQGLARAAVETVIAHARDTVGLDRLVAEVDVPNVRSHAVMRRCGFSEIGRAPGAVHDLVLYELPLLPVAEGEA